MIQAATHTPVKTEVTASRNSMPRRKATAAPVHAPVPGSGTPTNAATPIQRSCAPMASVFLSARLSRGPRSCSILWSRSAPRINGIGSMFPKTQSIMTCGTAMPIHRPTGTPPRNSTNGRAERTTRMAQSGRRMVERRRRASRCPRCGLSAATALAAATAWLPPSTSTPARAPSNNNGVPFLRVPRSFGLPEESPLPLPAPQAVPSPVMTAASGRGRCLPKPKLNPGARATGAATANANAALTAAEAALAATSTMMSGHVPRPPTLRRRARRATG
mmetsp:Transcript_17666/g.39932  ORF Transcript_17666/g.39932 Transcript_17666/m.39932 type:complete len:275 (-) Transcript_17666:70-894(-)